MLRKPLICLVLIGVLFIAANGIAQVGGNHSFVSSVSSTGGAVPWIAKERGFFTASGIDRSAQYLRRFIHAGAGRGAASIGSRKYLRPAQRDRRGCDVVVIGSFNNSAPYVMAARPDVRELKDLKGRKVRCILTGPATAMTQFMLEEAGLDAKRDVTILRVGGTAPG